MANRINYFKAAPGAMEILLEQEQYLHQRFSENPPLTVTILELVKLRVSQINQCAYCLNMHSKDALKLGESAERMIALSAWRDSPLYSDTERVALAWAELLTAGEPVNDADYQQALTALGDNGLVDLTILVNAINSWNRIVKAFKPSVVVG